MKNLSLIKILAILSVILLFLLVFPSQKYQIKLSSNQTGWVHKAKLKTDTSKRVTSTDNKEATVGVNVLNIREKPSLSSQVVGKLKLGTKITVHEEQTEWAKVVSSS